MRFYLCQCFSGLSNANGNYPQTQHRNAIKQSKHTTIPTHIYRLSFCECPLYVSIGATVIYHPTLFHFEAIEEQLLCVKKLVTFIYYNYFVSRRSSRLFTSVSVDSDTTARVALVEGFVFYRSWRNCNVHIRHACRRTFQYRATGCSRLSSADHVFCSSAGTDTHEV